MKQSERGDEAVYANNKSKHVQPNAAKHGYTELGFSNLFSGTPSHSIYLNYPALAQVIQLVIKPWGYNTIVKHLWVQEERFENHCKTELEKEEKREREMKGMGKRKCMCVRGRVDIELVGGRLLRARSAAVWNVTSNDCPIIWASIVLCQRSLIFICLPL